VVQDRSLRSLGRAKARPLTKRYTYGGFVPITDFKYFKFNDQIEASFSLDGNEVAWVKKYIN
jgi:hypothetical protein